MSISAFQIILPNSWPAKVRSAMLHVVSLAKYAAVYTRGWAADSDCHCTARQSDRVFHPQSGENSRGKVQNVVVNCSADRPHQSLDNELLKKPKNRGRPQTNRGNLEDEIVPLSEIRCKQRLGGLLKSYSRKAA